MGGEKEEDGGEKEEDGRGEGGGWEGRRRRMEEEDGRGEGGGWEQSKRWEVSRERGENCVHRIYTQFTVHITYMCVCR